MLTLAVNIASLTVRTNEEGWVGTKIDKRQLNLGPFFHSTRGGRDERVAKVGHETYLLTHGRGGNRKDGL
jgi:hypothetical protein